MNRRTLKKHCKRAASILIEKHGYDPKDFHPADGDECIYAPTNMERRYKRGGDGYFWLEPGPLKGTMLLWERVSVEYDEWDCKFPNEVLSDIELWENLTEEDVRYMLAA